MLAYKPINQLKNTLFTNTKLKAEKIAKTHVVYRISCTGNKHESCDTKYVGQTKNQLIKRLKQLKLSLKTTDLRNASGLVLHAKQNNHLPDFENAQIIDRERNRSKRLTLESLHIAANKICNVQIEKGNASAVYSLLVEFQSKKDGKTTHHH